jgi:hypothetical protein
LLDTLHASVANEFPGLLTACSGVTFEFLEDVLAAATKHRGFANMAARISERRHARHFHNEKAYLLYMRDRRCVPQIQVRFGAMLRLLPRWRRAPANAHARC